MNNLANLKNLVVMVVRGHITEVTDCTLNFWDPCAYASLDLIVAPQPHCDPRDHTRRLGIRGKCIGAQFSSCR